MTSGGDKGVFTRAFGRGHFPHQLSWLIDNPFRRLILPPRRLVDRLALSESDRVLELGPGSGYVSGELARRLPLGRLELLDLQPEMVAKARRKLRARGVGNAGFTAADASDLPFAGNVFDVALLVAVLGEIRDRRRCLQQLHRTIRPGGVLAIHEHAPDPDRIPFVLLRPMVEAEGFRFHRRLGPNWNYTALFHRP